MVGIRAEFRSAIFKNNLSVFTRRPTRAIRSSDARPEIVPFVVQCDALHVICGCKALVYREPARVESRHLVLPYKERRDQWTPH